ncbi:hypothetical protein [Wolbachia endosymbiont of Ctenocephalides felis wCfeT]|uniref:hypothetical protein n=1 Tax=Wolbachia endosymbiont of Ctenocephalides felis wCfeT TaxID=2732593 RepID=UPI00144630B7|nr:hypothetical protein [Wolbachia endosymbiont of Ctenocephalides felis wCfeT]
MENSVYFNINIKSINMKGNLFANSTADQHKPRSMIRDYYEKEPLRNKDYTEYSVSFNQKILTDNIWSADHKKCLHLYIKYCGLCDILCNYVTARNLLETAIKAEEGIKELCKDIRDTLHTLEDKFCDTHTLTIASIIEKILAFLFKIYPCNILSYSQQLNILDRSNNELKLNRAIFLNSFNQLEPGNHIKFSVLNRMALHGHSMLFIKSKDGAGGAFFDPNYGVAFFRTGEELCNIIDKKLEYYSKE